MRAPAPGNRPDHRVDHSERLGFPYGSLPATEPKLVETPSPLRSSQFEPTSFAAFAQDAYGGITNWRGGYGSTGGYQAYTR
jgi:hypothetical protein